MSLVAEGLAVGHGKRTVVAGISMAIATGEVFCLLGPNGCGKTTLFRTLLGLLPPLAGTVRLDGHRMSTLARRAIARRIGYVPQQHTPTFPFSVADVVMMGRTPHLGLFSRPGQADRRRVDAALARVGIAELSGADYSRLSGGQRQLVLIARALAGDADFLVMDEPTAGLDYGNQSLVLRQIRSLAGQGTGILLSSHEPDHVLAIGDRVALIRDGAILRQGDLDQVMDSDLLSRLYGMTVDVVALPDGRRVCLPGR